MSGIRLINDPGLLPWVIVAAYSVDALLTAYAASVADGRERAFWIATAVALGFLGLNKQLDLQTNLTEIARAIAKADNAYSWREYSLRRDLQGLFLLSLFVASAACLSFLLFWLRGSPNTVKFATLGLGILLAFVFIRAAAFHHINYWLPISPARRGDAWSLELVANAVVGSAAFLYYLRRRDSLRSPPK